MDFFKKSLKLIWKMRSMRRSTCLTSGMAKEDVSFMISVRYVCYWGCNKEFQTFIHDTFWELILILVFAEQDWNHRYGWTSMLCDAFESPASATPKIYVWPHQEIVGWYVHCVKNHTLLAAHDALSQHGSVCFRFLWGGHWCGEGNYACGDTSYYWLRERGLLHLSWVQWIPYIYVGEGYNLWWVTGFKLVMVMRNKYSEI